MKKLNKKAGFTLAELLIVVAIIAILVAIGIPAFSTAMERSRETVDLSNIRGAYAEFMAGTMGGTADTGYYQIDIKQRDCKSWIIDSGGFLTNVINAKMPTSVDLGVEGHTATNDKYPPKAVVKNAPLTTGSMWVRFTFVDPSQASGKELMKTPMLSFVALTAADGVPNAPAGVTISSGDVVGNAVEYEDTSVKVGRWYLTKEQK